LHTYAEFDEYAKKCRDVFGPAQLEQLDGAAGSSYRELGLNDIFVAQDVKRCDTIPGASAGAAEGAFGAHPKWQER